MKKLNTFKQVSRAKSAKHFRWNRKERFSLGHDYNCMALIDDEDGPQSQICRNNNPPIRVYRSEAYQRYLDNKAKGV